MNRLCALAGTAALMGLLATPAQASPIFDDTLIATGGDVIVTFVSNGAGYTSDLFLDGEAGDALGAIFNNWTTTVGTSMNLGSFAAGTEVIFKLLVHQTGDLFYTGDASRNRDNIVHARMLTSSERVLVGFEDLFGGGDLDYNDLVFAFTNVAPAADPGGDDGGLPAPVAADEPSTLLMFGGGLMALVFVMKRQAIKR